MWKYIPCSYFYPNLGSNCRREFSQNRMIASFAPSVHKHFQLVGRAGKISGMKKLQNWNFPDFWPDTFSLVNGRLFTELCHLGPFLGPFSKERLRKWKWWVLLKSEINKTLHERRWWPPPPRRHHLRYFETSHFLYQKEIPHFGWIVSIQQFLSRRNILDL